MTACTTRMLSLVTLYASGIHICWAVIILATGTGYLFTAAGALQYFFPNVALRAATLLISSGLAILASFFWKPQSFVWRVMLLLPQQVLLMLSLGSALNATFIGQFADGIARPWEFIFLDQIYLIAGVILHTLILVIFALQAIQTSAEGPLQWMKGPLNGTT